MVTSFYHGERNHYGFFTQVSNLILQSTLFIFRKLTEFRHLMDYYEIVSSELDMTDLEIIDKLHSAAINGSWCVAER